MADIYLTYKNLTLFEFLKAAPILKAYSFKETDIAREKSGKPYFISLPLYFNYSNTKGACVLILDDKPCGIDIENSSRKVSEKIAERYFPEIENTDLLIKAWTFKEAFVKYLGESMLAKAPHIKTDFNDIFYLGEKQSAGLFHIEKDGYFITAFSDSQSFNFSCL